MTTLEQLKAQAAAYLADADRRAARAATRRGTAGVTMLVVTIAEPAPADHGALLDRRRALAQEHATADWPAHTP